MSLLDKILEENEVILWKGTVSKRKLKKISDLHSIFCFLIIINIFIYILMSNLFKASNDVVIFFVVLFLISFIPSMIIIPLLIIKIENYNELFNIKYYITAKKIIAIIDKSFNNDFEDDTFCRIDLDKINKVRIIHLKNRKEKLINIEFYSNIISENPENYYIHVDPETFESLPVDGWMNTQDDEKLKFYYLKQNPKLFEILKELFSDKITYKL